MCVRACVRARGCKHETLTCTARLLDYVHCQTVQCGEVRHVEEPSRVAGDPSHLILVSIPDSCPQDAILYHVFRLLISTNELNVALKKTDFVYS